MNQGNNNGNNNVVQNPNPVPTAVTTGAVNTQPMQMTGTPVQPQPMPATGTPVQPQPVPLTPNNVAPTPLNNNDASQIFAAAPEFKQEAKPLSAPSVKPQPIEMPKQEENKPKEEVAPTQNIVNTTKKKSGNVILFIIIILIGVFVYKIDDVLDYFNQKYSPTPDAEVKKNDSDGLTDGYLLVGSSKGFIKLKSIKFSNVQKSDENTITIDYLADRKISNTNSLNIDIQLYDSNKVMIYNEMFSVDGSIEELLTKQYKLSLADEKYNDAFYALVLVKN